MNASNLNIEGAVSERYSQASLQAQAALCCPVDYDAQWLKVLPNELIERDYGCGDPSKWVETGDHVLDLGSGGGKICYIASQVVGESGSVIGIDMNDDMLTLARQYKAEIAERIGWDNVTFHKGKIQDLQLNMDQFDQWLQENPARDAESWQQAEQQAQQLRQTQTMIADNSIDVVVSNCVLNLVHPNDRIQLFAELHRVLKPGGRAVISDIVANQPVPTSLQNDATLWSGCVSGAYEDHAFLQAFADAGLGKMEILARQSEPWQVVEGIEFRSVTVRAWKPQATSDDSDQRKSAIYRGPWKEVVDDQGNVLLRGERMAITNGQMTEYQNPPLESDLILLESDPQTSQTSPPDELPIADCCGPGGTCC